MISTPRRIEIIEEFASLNPQGNVAICGGEILLQPQRLFDLSRRCNELDLQSQIATNGSLIDDAMAERLILEGPSQIALSLNSATAAVHDETRGRNGSFDEVVRAVKHLQRARSTHGRPTRIHIHTIISKRNYRELEALHQFALTELGVDRISMGFLQPTFGLEVSKADRYFAENVVEDDQALTDSLMRCDERFGLGLNPDWIEQAQMYHRSIRESGQAAQGWAVRRATEEHICETYQRNLTVDPQGVARLCFSSIFRGRKLRRRGDLTKFWNGADDIRRKMKRCHAHCGVVDICSRVRQFS